MTNKKTIEFFTSVANPKPELYQVISCTLGDADAASHYAGTDYDEALAIFESVRIGDKAVKSLFFDEEVFMREDNIKKEFPQHIQEELKTASEERFNELLHIYFADRMDVQTKIFCKLDEVGKAWGVSWYQISAD